jgi:predicted DNA-binding transcriptional regulator AlpA
MKLYSTNEVAKRLGLGLKTLARYIEDEKVPAPTFLKAGKSTYHAWTEEEIEHVRKLLPKIANGRKTRYQKKPSVLSNQQSAKTKPQPRAAVPHKPRKKKKTK